MNDERGFLKNVSAITPRDRAIDGSRRLARRSQRQAVNGVNPIDGSWICPACRRRSDNAADQAKHVAKELYQATLTLSELQLEADSIAAAIPDYAYAVTEARLALSEDDCRRAHAAFSRLSKAGLLIPEELRLSENEYQRRKMSRWRQRQRRASTLSTPDGDALDQVAN